MSHFLILESDNLKDCAKVVRRFYNEQAPSIMAIRHIMQSGKDGVAMKVLFVPGADNEAMISKVYAFWKIAHAAGFPTASLSMKPLRAGSDSTQWKIVLTGRGLTP